MALRGELPPGLSIRHSAVPGRLRLGVAGLRRHPERQREVEDAFAIVDGVRSVQASPLTGNVLVLYDPAQCSVSTILRSAAEVPRREPTQGGPHGRAPGTVEGPSEHERADPAAWSRTPDAERGWRSTPKWAAARRPLPAATPPPAWHALSAHEVARLLDTDPERGLAPGDAQARLRRVGPNRLPEPREPSLVRLVVRQFLNAPTLLLGAGAVVSLATGAVVDALLIGGVLLANAAIGTTTERSSQRAIAALRRAVPIRARVIRGGTPELVNADQLVPGDAIQLLPGDPVPADARLWEAHRLQVEESALTGEPHPVEKSPDPVEESAALADRHSVVYRGTTVTSGRGRAIVVGTGGRTAIGALRALAAEAVSPPPPLTRDLDRLGRQLAFAAAGVSLGLAGLSIIRCQSLSSSLGTAVALGVAAIPEGLPTTATTVLALGSGRMRQKGTLIRSLNAAEALGSVTVVCADKTGTITENRMAVRELRVDDQVIQVTGPALSTVGDLYRKGQRLRVGDDPALDQLLKIGVLCSDAEIAALRDGDVSIDGSSTEGALLVVALKAGIDVDDLRQSLPRIDRRDRGDGRRYMITIHRGADGLVALAKGAPDEILEICDAAVREGGTVPLDEAVRAALQEQNADMAGRAMRVLAFARKSLADGYQETDLYAGFTWCGLAGMTDPIRPAAPQAVRTLRRAGIRTVMITGDQAGTASAVARELGLADGGPLHILEAGDLAAIDPEVLRGLVRHTEVFARIPPETKLAIVRALQANNEIVAMTGDGVNDAPALRAADVGVAMGQRGTELARELADVVLSTDDFSRVVDAVEEGRLVRANVRRVLHYLLSTNASEVWAVAAAVAAGLPPPLTAGQLLWLNLISDLTPALGLAMEPHDPDLMRQPPRDPREPIIPSRLQRRILGESAAMAAGSLAAYALGILRHRPGPVAQTMAFWSLATSQLLLVPLARAGATPATRYERPVRRPLVVGVGISTLLQLGVLLVGSLRGLLGCTPLGPVDTLLSLVAAVTPVAAIEAQRLLGSPRASARGAGERRPERGDSRTVSESTHRSGTADTLPGEGSQKEAA